MKVLILAGGYGTRISEESHLKPKPMIEIGSRPVIWHIMKSYSSYGFNEFIICAGYKQHIIKEYFATYYLHCSDITFDFNEGQKTIEHKSNAEPWKVTVVDTGLDTMTGGRIKRVRPHLKNEPFLLTYGDGVANVDIMALVGFHRAHGKMATITAVRPESRFGILDLNDNAVLSFREKSVADTGWINGGFMVLEPGVFAYLEGDETIFEGAPMESLARDKQLMAYKHDGFWQCMDTQRDKQKLDELWKSGNPPWRNWE